jgi:hypothetical protein
MPSKIHARLRPAPKFLAFLKHSCHPSRSHPSRAGPAIGAGLAGGKRRSRPGGSDTHGLGRFSQIQSRIGDPASRVLFSSSSGGTIVRAALARAPLAECPSPYQHGPNEIRPRDLAMVHA